MNNLQKMGGVSALVMAAAYITGIALFMTILKPDGDLKPVEELAFLAQHETATYLTMLFIYVITGIALIILVQALYERLKNNSPALMQTTAILGFIWGGIVIAAGMIFLIGMDTVIKLYQTEPTQAITVWATVGIVFNGLGGGTEFVGGLWTLLISWTALKHGVFPKALNYLGFVIGAAGIATIVPMLEELTMVFGLTQIPWFICLGLTLFNADKNVTRIYP